MASEKIVPLCKITFYTTIQLAYFIVGYYSYYHYSLIEKNHGESLPKQNPKESPWNQNLEETIWMENLIKN